MKSVPTIFFRDKITHEVFSKQVKQVQWVFDGKGTATRKWDGLGIKVENGKFYYRYKVHTGDKAGVPNGFVRCQDPDPKRPYAPLPGWVLVPDTFKTHPHGKIEWALKEALGKRLEALNKAKASMATKITPFVNQWAPAPELHPVTEIPNGTYELCGPRIFGNHEKLKEHVLLKHGEETVKKVPRSFEKLKAFLETYEGEGIVWHYDVGTGILMAEIKRSDFGFNQRITKEDAAMAYRKEPAVKGTEILVIGEAPSLLVSAVMNILDLEGPTGNSIKPEKL